MIKRKIGVLISGSGSNLQALIDAMEDNHPGEIVLVISNNPQAYGLIRANNAGISTRVISHLGKNREEYDRELHAVLVSHGVEFVCLAGFMRLLSEWFVGQWSGRLLNIHPSILPRFTGLNTHQRAIDAGEKLHGCTVHYVIPALDAGPIIVQMIVPILPHDTAETLSLRVLDQEHIAYPMALMKVLLST